MLISPLIKPGTVSSTYYNHYSTLRTLEDLFLTGKSCTNPSNADTPLAAGTVCGGLDGQGHIGYAAQAGLASFGPDVFTAEHFSAVTAPHGYAAVGGSRPDGRVLPRPRQPRSGGPQRAGPEPASSPATAARPEPPAAGRAAATAASGATVPRRAGHGGKGGNGGNGACPAEEWGNGTWLTAAGAPTTPANTPPCNGNGGNGGTGGNGGNGFGRFPGGNGGNGGNGLPGRPGRNGTPGTKG